jgi:hypothetical protein
LAQHKLVFQAKLSGQMNVSCWVIPVWVCSLEPFKEANMDFPCQIVVRSLPHTSFLQEFLSPRKRTWQTLQDTVRLGPTTTDHERKTKCTKKALGSQLIAASGDIACDEDRNRLQIKEAAYYANYK